MPILTDFLLGCRGIGFARGGGGASTTSSGGAADAGEKGGDVLSLKGLSEEAGPVALDRVSASLDDLVKLLLL